MSPTDLPPAAVIAVGFFVFAALGFFTFDTIRQIHRRERP
jgi:hypothetical protein